MTRARAAGIGHGAAGAGSPAGAGTVSEKGSFRRAFRAEVLKGRHAAPRKIALAAPIPFCVLGLLGSGIIPGTGAIGGAATYLWNYWYVLMMPVVIALICVSVANIDARQKLRPVLGLPLAPACVWWAKVTYALVLVLAANLVIFACSTALMLAGDEVSGVAEALTAVLILTVASSWMVPVALGLASRFGTLAGIAVPTLLQVGVGIVGGTSEMWFAFPPAATVCAVVPFVGVAPSGVPLEAGDPLGVFGWQGVAGIVIAVAVFAVLAYAGARWYAKREAA